MKNSVLLSVTVFNVPNGEYRIRYTLGTTRPSTYTIICNKNNVFCSSIVIQDFVRHWYVGQVSQNLVDIEWKFGHRVKYWVSWQCHDVTIIKLTSMFLSYLFL